MSIKTILLIIFSMLIIVWNMWKKMLTTSEEGGGRRLHVVSWVRAYMKDVQYAETCEKSIFWFLVFEIWSIFTQIGKFSKIFEYKIDHNSKIEIANLIFHSFQQNLPVSHLPTIPTFEYVCTEISILDSSLINRNLIVFTIFHVNRLIYKQTEFYLVLNQS